MVKSNKLRDIMDTQLLTFRCHTVFFKTFLLSDNFPKVYISYTSSIKIIKLNFFFFPFISDKNCEIKKSICVFIFYSKISLTDMKYLVSKTFDIKIL